MLVCDDDARSYEHVVSTLESMGAYVDQAPNTMVVASLTSQKPYDLILFSSTRMLRQCADQLVALRWVYLVVRKSRPKFDNGEKHRC